MPDSILNDSASPGDDLFDVLTARRLNAIQDGVRSALTPGNISVGPGLIKTLDSEGQVSIDARSHIPTIKNQHPFQVRLEPQTGNDWDAIINVGAIFIMGGEAQRNRPFFADIHTKESFESEQNRVAVGDGDTVYVKLLVRGSLEYMWELDTDQEKPITIEVGDGVPDDILPEPAPLEFACGPTTGEHAVTPAAKDFAEEVGEIYLPICKIDIKDDDAFVTNSIGIPHTQDLSSDAFLAPYEPPSSVACDDSESEEEENPGVGSGGGSGGGSDSGSGGGSGGDGDGDENDDAPPAEPPAPPKGRVFYSGGIQPTPQSKSVDHSFVSSVTSEPAGEGCAQIQVVKGTMRVRRGQFTYQSIVNGGKGPRREGVSFDYIESVNHGEGTDSLGPFVECGSVPKTGRKAPGDYVTRINADGSTPEFFPAVKSISFDPASATLALGYGGDESITIPDATTTGSGLVPALTGSATQFLDGQGNFTTPPDTVTPPFSTSNAGTVPAPTSDDVNNDKILRADGTWVEAASIVDTDEQDLSYTSNSRTIGISGGASATLPVHDSTNDGLISAYPNDASKFYNGAGSYTVPPDTTYDDYATGVSGLVPGPTSSDVSADKILRADGTWAAETKQNVNYSSVSNAVTIDGASGFTLTNHDSANAGLIPAHPNDSSKFYDGAGSFSDLPTFATNTDGVVSGPSAADVSNDRLLRADGTWVDANSVIDTDDQDLGYTSATRAVTIDGGAGFTFPIHDGSNAGLIPSHPNDAGKFYNGAGSFAELPEFSTNTAGVVPSPSTADVSNDRLLRADGTWIDANSLVDTDDQDLQYDAATGDVSIDNGAGFTIPEHTGSNPGLIPAHPNDSSKFYNGAGSYETPLNTTYGLADGTNAGLVPPIPTDSSKFYNGAGSYTTPPDTTYSDYTTGVSGLVPGPSAADVSNDRLLRADGSWIDANSVIDTDDQDLGYTSSTRAVTIDGGAGFTFPLHDGSNAGLIPSHPNDSSKFYNGAGSYTTPPNTTYDDFEEGSAGLVPAPSISDISGDKVLQADGSWVDQANTAVEEFTTGVSGLVPGPSASDVSANKFLRADKTWAAETKQNVNYSSPLRSVTIDGGSGFTFPTHDANNAGLIPSHPNDSSKFYNGAGSYTTPPNTTYGEFNTNSDGLVPGPSASDVSANKFLRADKTWAAETKQNVNYSSSNRSVTIDGASGFTFPVHDGSNAGLIPARPNDSSKFYNGAGSYSTPPNTTYSDFATNVDGLVPGPSLSDQLNNKVLRADGTWVTQSGGSDQDLSYTSSTRTIEISDGASATLPTHDSTNAGLIPSHPNDSSKFYNGAGSYTTPPDTTYSDYTTGVSGLVPGPSAADVAANKFLRADKTWAAETKQNVNYSSSTGAVTIDGGSGFTIPLHDGNNRGLIPPRPNDSSKFYNGAGSYTVPPNTTYDEFGTNADGLVPGPTFSEQLSNKVLKADGSWTSAVIGVADTSTLDLTVTAGVLSGVLKVDDTISNNMLTVSANGLKVVNDFPDPPTSGHPYVLTATTTGFAWVAP